MTVVGPEFEGTIMADTESMTSRAVSRRGRADREHADRDCEAFGPESADSEMLGPDAAQPETREPEPVPVPKSAVPPDGLCQLCRRDAVYNFHHLIPRKNHRNRWFTKRYDRETLNLGLHICRQCHQMIHTACPSEKELGRSYHTFATLTRHPVLARYLAWKRRRSESVPPAWSEDA